MSKEHITLNWEQDWDCENIYYNVTVDGKIVMCDIETMVALEISF